VQECTTNSILLSLVAVGMGVGFVTSSTTQSPAHNIRLVPIADLGLKFDVLMVWRSRDSSAALRRFIEMMADDAGVPFRDDGDGPDGCYLQRKGAHHDRPTAAEGLVPFRLSLPRCGGNAPFL
jgi:hypothetical protein